MPLRRPTALTALALAGCLACSDPSGLEAPVVASISVTGLPDTVGVGDHIALEAAARAADGTRLTDVEVSWRSLTPTVATIDAGGALRALDSGEARLVVAALGRRRVEDTLHVPVRRLPRSLAIGGLGDSLIVRYPDTATVIVRDGTGAALATPVRWSVSDTSRFFIDSARGRIVARDQGTAWVYARVRDLVDSVLVRGAYHEIALPTTFTQLAIGDFATWCARTPDGQAWCTPHLFDRPDFSRVAGTPLFPDLQAAYGYACGLAPDGRAWCWGANESGQLGRGSTAPVGQQLAPAPALDGRPLRQLAVGQGFAQSACGILAADSTVVCWGFNGYGNTGSDTLGVDSIPGPVHGGLKALEIDAGPYHACAIAIDRAVWCWGSRQNYGIAGDVTMPEQVDPPGDWVQVETNAGITCLLAGNGTVRCRTLDQFNSSGTSIVAPVTGTARYVRLFSSYWGTMCGITDAGALLCWGIPVGGNGATTLVPRAVMPQHRFVSMGFGDGAGIAGRFDHACALTTDSRMFCW